MALPHWTIGEGELDATLLTQLAKQDAPALELSDTIAARISRYRDVIESSLASGKTYYGINTGFGLLADVVIETDKLVELQFNLVRSHACGVGPTLRPELARGLMILKAHNFALGHSGVRLDVVSQLLAMIQRNIVPVIPEKGSVGASGDLAPLAHLALALIGEGEVFYKHNRCSSKDAMAAEGIKPLILAAKEGLSLINGTQYMGVRAANLVVYARELLFAADVIAALSLDASRGTMAAFDNRVHQVRKQEGQRIVAENIRTIFSGYDAIMKSHETCGKVQDPYSFRCIPQVHGASRDTWAYVSQIVNRELNSVSDNPLVFEDGAIISGGNFHGQPLALAMDFLAIAMAEIGSISERRIEKLTDPNMSGLPAFLTKDSGLHSGYMIPHVVAASLVSENKILSHPASVDSIPTSADKEDHVSMGPIAAHKAEKICDNVSYVLAIELLAAAQGVDLLAPLKPGKFLMQVVERVREVSPPMQGDRAMSAEIEAVALLIRRGMIREIAADAKVDLK